MTVSRCFGYLPGCRHPLFRGPFSNVPRRTKRRVQKFACPGCFFVLFHLVVVVFYYWDDYWLSAAVEKVAPALWCLVKLACLVFG